MAPESCITLSNIGFALNFAGFIVAAFGLDEPLEQTAGGLKRILVYVRRPRVFTAGMILIGFGIVALVAGYYGNIGCLSLHGFVPSKELPDLGARPFCDALRPLIPDIADVSMYGTLLAVTILLAVTGLWAAFILGAGWMGSIHGVIRIMFGGLLAPPMFIALMLLGTKLYVTAFEQQPPALQRATGEFHLEDYESDADNLVRALNNVIPIGTSRARVEIALAGTAASAKGNTVSYLYRTKSLMACLFSSPQPPPAWRIDVSYTPGGVLKAMLVKPSNAAPEK